MNVRTAFGILLFMLTATGCTVRRISDNQPPKNGTISREIQDHVFGPIDMVETYKDGHLIRKVGTFKNGVTAYDYHLRNGEREVDSLVSNYPSGQRRFVMILKNDVILSNQEWYEDGAVKVLSDSVLIREYYSDGTLRSRTTMAQGSVVSTESWYPGGRRWEFVEWKNDQYHGMFRMWDSTGRLTVDERYRNGTLVQR